MENLHAPTFQEQLEKDLEARETKFQKLASLVEAEADGAITIDEVDLKEVADIALQIISDDQSIIKAMGYELRDSKEQPMRFQERIDEGLIAQIEHWKNQFEWLQARFNQYQKSHF